MRYVFLYNEASSEAKQGSVCIIQKFPSQQTQPFLHFWLHVSARYVRDSLNLQGQIPVLISPQEYSGPVIPLPSNGFCRVDSSVVA
jgi:hypothetical protein